MNIIFLGGFFPEQFRTSILSKSKLQIQNAANTFQWAFIKGIEQNLNRPIKLITALFIGWYPKYYTDLFVRKRYFSNLGIDCLGIMIGFLNLPLIKNLIKYIKLKPAISQFLSSNDHNIIIVYSIDLFILKASLNVKKSNPETKVCVIVTDCYNYHENTNIIHRFYLRYFERPILTKLLAKVDCFVVLTDKMVDYLSIRGKPWVRIEGILDENAIRPDKNINKDNENKIVLYTGTLEFPYGIKELLSAFKLIKSPEYRLWICGGGPGAEIVKQSMLIDNRISYFGIVSKERITELQSLATILINPRNTIGEYNKYSFPSKTIEYLASGTPALLYRLEGIPEEYFQYCYTVDDNTIESLSKAIYKTCELDPHILNQKAQSAREFILKNKTAKMQCNKVLRMLNI